MPKRLSQILGTDAPQRNDPPADRMVIMDGRPPESEVLPGPAPEPSDVVIGGQAGMATPRSEQGKGQSRAKEIRH